MSNSMVQIRAANDPILRARLIQLAANKQIPHPEPWVGENMGRLVTAPFGADNTSVASMWEYAETKLDEAKIARTQQEFDAKAKRDAAITAAEKLYAVTIAKIKDTLDSPATDVAVILDTQLTTAIEWVKTHPVTT